MTVSSALSRKTYAGNGVTTSFATTPVVFFDATDLVVSVTDDATGAVTALTLNTHYTVSGGGTVPAVGTVDTSGGSAPYGAPAAGTTVTIFRDVAATQETDFVQNDGSDAEASEATLDRLTMIAQRLSERLDRAVALPDGDVTGASMEIPALEDRASKTLGFDAAGALTIYAPASAVTDAANVTTTASGTGAISEDLQSRGRWWQLVTDYMSVADRASLRSGTTVNIDTALANAHTALPTNGGDILFPPGVYKLTAEPGFTKRVRMVGMGGQAVTAGGTGSCVITKASTMSTALVQFTVDGSSIENLEFEGEVGNTGDGIVIHAGRCSLKNVAVYSMGNDGIRIGSDTGANSNLWFLQNIKSKSNGRYGVYMHDNTPDANGGTLIHCDLQANGVDGLRLNKARLNTFVGVCVQTNTGDGVHLASGAFDNTFVGGDFDEGNVSGFDLKIDSGATRNAFFWPALSSTHLSDSGTGSVLFYKSGTIPGALGWSGLSASAGELNGMDSDYVRLFDDFLGDVLADQWNGRVGTDPQCIAPLILPSQARGIVRLVAGDDAAADMATNGVQLESALNWRAVQSSLVFEARLAINTITSVAVYLGFTDQVSALEMPFTLGASDVLTSNATNGCGVLFDTAADTDNWWLVGVAADVDATAQNTGVAPTAATQETWRIELTSGGVATFYRNGTAIGSAMTGAVTAATQLTPVIAMFSRTSATRSVDCDFLKVQSAR